jgi:hypothetical protein
MARLATKLFRDVMPREIVSFVMVIRNYFGPFMRSVSIIFGHELLQLESQRILV